MPSGRSHLTYLLDTLNTVTHLMNDRENVDIYFLDSSKAFDVVYHRFLCAKLTTLKALLLMEGWIRNSLTNHSFQAYLGYAIPEEATVSSGVLQGSAFGPHMFICMTDDLQKSFCFSSGCFLMIQ